MKSEEQRAYSRGYAAGRKRADRDYDKELADERREEFRRQAALAALTAIAAPGSNWGRKIEGIHKPYSTMSEYAEAAFKFADELCKRTAFSGRREKSA